MRANDANNANSTYVMMDGPYHHKTEECIEFYRAERANVLIMSPMSPQIAPVEMVHGFMKKGDLRNGMDERNES